MKTEDLDFVFKIHEVKRYAKCGELIAIYEDRLEEMNDIAAEVYPTMTYPDYGTQTYYVRGMNVEQFVLDRLDKTAMICHTIATLKEKQGMFDLAMSELTPRERDVVSVLFYHKNFKDLQVSRLYFEELKEQVVNKLFAYFEMEREKKIQKQKIKNKESLNKRATGLRIAIEKRNEEEKIMKENGLKLLRNA